MSQSFFSSAETLCLAPNDGSRTAAELFEEMCQRHLKVLRFLSETKITGVLGEVPSNGNRTVPLGCTISVSSLLAEAVKAFESYQQMVTAQQDNAGEMLH